MDFRDIRRAALAQGWRVEQTKKGEMFFSPDGRTIVVWHATPSDRRAVRNFLARMRSGGLEYPSRRKR